MKSETIGYCHVCNEKYDTTKDGVNCCDACDIIVHSKCGVKNDDGVFWCNPCDIQESGDWDLE